MEQKRKNGDVTDDLVATETFAQFERYVQAIVRKYRPAQLYEELPDAELEDSEDGGLVELEDAQLTDTAQLAAQLLEGHATMARLFVENHRDEIKIVDKKSFEGYLYNHSKALWEKAEKAEQFQKRVTDWLVSIAETELASAKAALEKRCLELKQETPKKRGRGRPRKDAAECPKEIEELQQRVDAMQSLHTLAQSQTTGEKVWRLAKVALLDEDFRKCINRSEKLLPIKNKLVVMLDSGRTRPRTKADCFGVECPVNLLDKGADLSEFPNAKRLFEGVMCHREAETAYLLKMLGYYLTGDVSARKFFIWYGEKGSNGKSLIMSLLAKMLGPLALTGDEKLFVKRQMMDSASGHSEYLTVLEEPRLVYLGETQEADKLNEDLLKRVSGGDAIRARGLQKSSAEFVSQAKMVILTNWQLAHSGAQSIWDRMSFIPFKQRYVDNPDPAKGEEARDIEFGRKCGSQYLDELFTCIVKLGAVEWYKDRSFGDLPETFAECLAEHKREVNGLIRSTASCATLANLAAIMKCLPACSTRPMLVGWTDSNRKTTKPSSPASSATLTRRLHQSA